MVAIEQPILPSLQCASSLPILPHPSVSSSDLYALVISWRSNHVGRKEQEQSGDGASFATGADCFMEEGPMMAGKYKIEQLS